MAWKGRGSMRVSTSVFYRRRWRVLGTDRNVSWRVGVARLAEAQARLASPRRLGLALVAMVTCLGLSSLLVAVLKSLAKLV